MSIPGYKAIEAAYLDLRGIHDRQLKQYGVTMPRWGTAKAHWLGVLWATKRWVSKNEMSVIVRRDYPDKGTDQQVRHLRRDGWNVENDGRGLHKLSDPYRPQIDFVLERQRRLAHLNTTSFEDLKKNYGHRCATCGEKEGERHRYHDKEVILEQGHCDPHKPNTMENTIPQCQFCNRGYRDDFVFDKEGRVCAVASTRPVLRAAVRVKREIFAKLGSLFSAAIK